MANLVRYRPFSPFALSDTIDRFFNSAFNSAWAPTFPSVWSESAYQTFRAVPANLYETEDAYNVILSLPGIDPNALQVTVKQDVLTVTGTRSLPMPENAQPIWRGIGEGQFQYSFTLPGAVMADRVEARYEHGLLLLHLPKVEAQRAHRIAVKAGTWSGNGQPTNS